MLAEFKCNQGFPVSATEWNSWKWQLKNRFRSINSLAEFLELEIAAVDLRPFLIPFTVTPFYASLIKNSTVQDRLLKSVLPDAKELEICPEELPDPLYEKEQSPCSAIVHRYPDRVLFLVTNQCNTYCRYCTRSRLTGKKPYHTSEKDLQEGLDYIRREQNIREVIVSGGDPFTLDNNKLNWILSHLYEIKHVQLIRIGTKTPFVLPQRINKGLTDILKKYPPIYINLHVIHPDELVTETELALARLIEAGCVLSSQTVLLKEINDDAMTLKSLMEKLLKNRTRPYALYHCDLVTGTSHFRTELSSGIRLIEELRKTTSGLAIPHYVVDPPGGKATLNPGGLISEQEGEYVLKNWQGESVRYRS